MGDIKIIFGQQIYMKWDHYLLRIEVLNIYYVWQMFSPNMLGVDLWKTKKLKRFFFGFAEIIIEYKRKPIELWVDQKRDFYNSDIQKWLNDNILMYSTYNEVNSIVAAKFIRTLNGKIYKKMTINLILVIWIN